MMIERSAPKNPKDDERERRGKETEREKGTGTEAETERQRKRGERKREEADGVSPVKKKMTEKTKFFGLWHADTHGPLAWAWPRHEPTKLRVPEQTIHATNPIIHRSGSSTA